jgi:hypothetical protein
MLQFTDICIQTRYDGTAKTLGDRFFVPVGCASVFYRARISALNIESLLAVALAIPTLQKANAKIQLLIVLPPLPAPSETVHSVVATDRDALQEQIIQKLPGATKIVAAAGSAEANLINRFEVKVCSSPENHVEIGSPLVGVKGFFTDESGGSVAYGAHWEGDKSVNRSERGLTVSWSWGDPQLS